MDGFLLCSSASELSHSNAAEESFGDDSVPMEAVDYHRLILPLESIHWVDSTDEFLKCLDHVKHVSCELKLKI